MRFWRSKKAKPLTRLTSIFALNYYLCVGLVSSNRAYVRLMQAHNSIVHTMAKGAVHLMLLLVEGVYNPKIALGTML